MNGYADLILKEIKRCRKNKLGNSRPNQLLKVAKASFSYANKRLGLELKNPCTGIEKLPEDDRVKFIPTEEMILAVKAKCNQVQQELIDFCHTLETVCIETVEGGVMTKDLALCIHGKELQENHYVSTEDFLDALDKGLQGKFS